MFLNELKLKITENQLKIGKNINKIKLIDKKVYLRQFILRLKRTAVGHFPLEPN